jgi:hypothetical protein
MKTPPALNVSSGERVGQTTTSQFWKEQRLKNEIEE